MKVFIFWTQGRQDQARFRIVARTEHSPGPIEVLATDGAGDPSWRSHAVGDSPRVSEMLACGLLALASGRCVTLLDQGVGRCEIDLGRIETP